MQVQGFVLLQLFYSVPLYSTASLGQSKASHGTETIEFEDGRNLFKTSCCSPAETPPLHDSVHQVAQLSEPRLQNWRPRRPGELIIRETIAGPIFGC